MMAVERDQFLPQIQQNDLELLLQTIQNTYGYDFADYSASSLIRRIQKFLVGHRVTSVAALRNDLQNDKFLFNSFIEEITVNVTDFFRDPYFFSYLRNDIIPVLATQPLIRIWHAGCSTGEEVYSMAILLEEEGLISKSIIYATDINQTVLEFARAGIYSPNSMESAENNYRLSGGKNNFKSYFSITNDAVAFSEKMKRNILFSAHNLVSDQSFNEFHLILCRNVLIYFNSNLQNRVLKLFSNSLSPNSFLALGSRESIGYSSVSEEFERVNKEQKVWIKKQERS